MYLSLRWYSLSKSYETYRSFLANLSLYKVYTKVLGRNFYNNTFIFYHIASTSKNEDIIRSITSTEIDEILLIYNMYSTFLSKDKNVIFDTYPIFYLNTPSKYKSNELAKIDLLAQEDRVKKVKEFHFGKNFIGYFSHKFLTSLNHAFVYRSRDMGELIENLKIINDLYSFKNKSYEYLEYLSVKISDILKILKYYLQIADFEDMLEIVKEENSASYAFDFYLNIYLFYNTSSIIIDIDLYLKYTGGQKNQNFKVFLILDKSFYTYKDINDRIKTEIINNKDLENNKRDIFKSDFFVKKRYNKINMF